MKYEFKSDLAAAYFPYVSPKTAKREFRQMLHDTPGLMDELENHGYRKSQKRLTPRQVNIILARLGEP